MPAGFVEELPRAQAVEDGMAVVAVAKSTVTTPRLSQRQFPGGKSPCTTVCGSPQASGSATSAGGRAASLRAWVRSGGVSSRPAASRERLSGAAARQPQQPPPQQPPPPAAGRGAADPEAAAVPPTATVDRSLTVSSCPAGHSAGAEDSAIGRLSSNVVPQERQRYS